MTWAMLAAPVPRCSPIPAGEWYVQEKFDGVRANSNGLLRSGRTIPNKFLADKFAELPPGLDGEIVCKDLTLPELAGRVNSYGGGIEGLQYMVFDLISGDPQDVRLGMLEDLRGQLPDWASVAPLLAVCEEEGFRGRDTILSFAPPGSEGVVLRRADGFYSPGRKVHRRSALLKLKLLEEYVGTVIEVTRGQLGMAALVVEVPGFTVPAVVGTGYTDEFRHAAGRLFGEKVMFKARFVDGLWREASFVARVVEERSDL